MGKSDKLVKAKKAAAKPSSNDIDAIFASKASTSKLPPAPAATLPVPKKKRKKSKATAPATEVGEAVEVVQDTSGQIEQMAPAKSAKLPAAEEELFMDSRGKKRGLSPLASCQAKGNAGRRTEDGLPIYSVEELCGKGGETDDCPFDCDCCESFPSLLGKVSEPACRFLSQRPLQQVDRPAPSRSCRTHYVGKRIAAVPLL
jgi:hypothetical protein